VSLKIIDGGITSPLGFKATGIHCGIKKEKPDLALIYSERPAFAAVAYTQNKMRAAPIEVMMERDSEMLQAFVVNSGNANAITGPRGIKDARSMTSVAAKQLNLKEDLVGVASTGIIGRFLPMDRIRSGIKSASGMLGRGREFDQAAASAILTTDKVIKEAACRVVLDDGTTVTIGGMCKGSGMIAPSMKALHATTLSFVTTDAVLSGGPESQWQESIDRSFNMIDVDGDQSTNDISAFMANGAAGGPPVDEDLNFWEGVNWVTKTLAKDVVMDGEGATKIIELTVTGAKNAWDARRAGKSIVSSNLVKCAIFGADPNFGRILAALGNSGSEFNLPKVKLTIGSNGYEITLFEGGVPLVTPGSEVEARARELLKEKEITMNLELGVGIGSAEAWGCDLSYEYVKINAEYTT